VQNMMDIAYAMYDITWFKPIRRLLKRKIRQIYLAAYRINFDETINAHFSL